MYTQYAFRMRAEVSVAAARRSGQIIYYYIVHLQ